MDGFRIFKIDARSYTTATSKPNDFTDQNKETYSNIPIKMVPRVRQAINVWSYFDEKTEKDQQTRALIIWSQNQYKEYTQNWYRNEVMKYYIKEEYEEFKKDSQIRNHAIKMINGNNLQWKDFMAQTPAKLFETVREDLKSKNKDESESNTGKKVETNDTPTTSTPTNDDNGQISTPQTHQTFTAGIHVNTGSPALPISDSSRSNSDSDSIKRRKPMWDGVSWEDLSNSNQ